MQICLVSLRIYVCHSDSARHSIHRLYKEGGAKYFINCTLSPWRDTLENSDYANTQIRHGWGNTRVKAYKQKR